MVEKEIMPVRRLIDDSKDHKLIDKILQRLTDIGFQRICFSKEYAGDNHLYGVTYFILAEEIAR